MVALTRTAGWLHGGEASGKQQDDGQRFKKKLMKTTQSKTEDEASAPANVRPSSVSKKQTESPFGEVIYAYTRKQAVADGAQVEVSQTAREAGIRFPVFLTRAVFDAYVTVPPNVTCQDEAGRLWDIVWMLRHAIGQSNGGDRLPFALYVRNDNRRAKLVKLVAACGPLDMDDPQPAITVMLPGED